MKSDHKTLEALRLVVASAVRNRNGPGVIISQGAFDAVQALVIGTGEAVRFADGKFGCQSCGAYANANGEIAHLATCDRGAVSEGANR